MFFNSIQEKSIQRHPFSMTDADCGYSLDEIERVRTMILCGSGFFFPIPIGVLLHGAKILRLDN